ncbi:hypothetical protein EI555_004805 [Monodon monoceros]|uniref:C2H2-type domain-containing protein n=1 Tax=Monodon monoceros TaxID=40151 RepID=A0A4U1ECE4_MONMO|nr:hypothetical protein EI555_004805 [Monodon monoceros]
MDVSKVKLKKTKKREADLPDNKITNEKTETEQTKMKGDVTGKKNERSVKVEKKDNVSKEKKPCSNASSQVTTRTRKSALEAKEMDVHPGNNAEKSCKSKKSKRKTEAEARSLQEPVNDEEPVTKKKKKAESKSRNSQEVPKGDSKVEENKKQSICMKNSGKKKTLRSKSCKKSGKPAQRRATQIEPPPPMESAEGGPVQTEPPPAAPPSPPPPLAPERHAEVEVVQAEPPPPPPLPPPSPPPPLPPGGHAEVEVVQKGPVHAEPPPPVEPIPKRSPHKDNGKEKSNMQSEMAQKEQVLIEVGLVPVKDRQLLKESAGAQDLLPPLPPLPKEDLKEEESEDQKLVPAGEGHKEAPLQKVEAEEADKSLAGLAAVTKASASISSSEQNLTMPEGETSDGKRQADAMLCEMKMDADEKKTENPPGRDSVVEEPASPPLLPLPLEKCEAVSTATVASPPVTVAVNESQEMDEDEGIHSHDGSDLSDNMSEDSDDSGLNGARPVPQETSRKNGKEALAVKVAEGDFVCIFCDRSFRKEKDYSKHLNRHLVNVYFLEEAAQGQE